MYLYDSQMQLFPDFNTFFSLTSVVFNIKCFGLLWHIFRVLVLVQSLTYVRA